MKDVLESSQNKKKLIAVKTIKSPSCDDEKIMMSSDVLKNPANIVCSIINDTDFRIDGIHLNEAGATKRLERIHAKIKSLNLLTIIKEGKGFLANRFYSKVTKEYIFGCKKCSKPHDFMPSDFILK